MSESADNTVKVTVDGEEYQVAAGRNLIDVVSECGGDVPHYCYHPNLSVAGNCRMCQVEVVGMPKLTIACNTMVRDGMEVKTHKTSQMVADAQAATLEFILINHPLDCTVCDQAGHCKLQDYHYDYNARPSRFLEEKVKQVKAKPLGPTVNLDGERCISCTRCVRFCDEITGTSELGLVNRGDKSVITVNEHNPLDNPFSGTVVDLCPVGALTHEEWRFNTRIWFTQQVDSICPGCSTGCNVKAAERDGKVVLVKARMNQDVNKEWLCDAGRYGFPKLQPEHLLKKPVSAGKSDKEIDVAKDWKKLKSKVPTLIALAPDLTLEDYVAVKALTAKRFSDATVVCNYKTRELSKVEEILISPDYAPNYQGFIFAGLAEDKDLESAYAKAMQDLSDGKFKQAIFIGDRSHNWTGQDESSALENHLSDCNVWAFLTDRDSPLIRFATAIPSRGVLERSGLFFNRSGRLQYLQGVLPVDEYSMPVWRRLAELEPAAAKAVGKGMADREATRHVLKQDDRLADFGIAQIKKGGVDCSAHFQ